jgi:hypothetical protein
MYQVDLRFKNFVLKNTQIKRLFKTCYCEKITHLRTRAPGAIFILFTAAAVALKQSSLTHK